MTDLRAIRATIDEQPARPIGCDGVAVYRDIALISGHAAR